MLENFPFFKISRPALSPTQRRAPSVQQTLSSVFSREEPEAECSPQNISEAENEWSSVSIAPYTVMLRAGTLHFTHADCGFRLHVVCQQWIVGNTTATSLTQTQQHLYRLSAVLQFILSLSIRTVTGGTGYTAVYTVTVSTHRDRWHWLHCGDRMPMKNKKKYTP